MTHTSHPIRPARAAIAAVLALTATPLLAQETPGSSPVMPPPEAMQPAGPNAFNPTLTPEIQVPTAQPANPAVPNPAGPETAPPTASGPAATGPAPSTSLPGEPMPMAIPVAPPLADDAPTTSVAPPADVTERPATATRAAPIDRETTQPTTAPASGPTNDVQPSTDATPEPLAVPPEESADLIPMAPAASPVETPVQQDAAVSDTESGQGDVWGYLAGLLALLGIGGGAIALRNTRTRKSARMAKDAPLAAAPDGRLAGPHDRPQSTGVTTPVPAPSTARFDEPVLQTPTVAPMAASRSTRRRAPAAARSDLTIDERRLEDMIAQKPSRDNPFKTRANRKRRAIWLLRNSYPMQSAA